MPSAPRLSMGTGSESRGGLRRPGAARRTGARPPGGRRGCAPSGAGGRSRGGPRSRSRVVVRGHRAFLRGHADVALRVGSCDSGRFVRSSGVLTLRVNTLRVFTVKHRDGRHTTGPAHAGARPGRARSSRPHEPTDDLAHRRPGPAGRADRRHHPLLPARGPAPAGRAGRPDQALRPRAPRPARPDPRPPGAPLLARRDPGAARLRAARARRRHLRRRSDDAPTPSTSSSSASGVDRDLAERAPRRRACCATRPSSGATPTTATDLDVAARRRPSCAGSASPTTCSSSSAGIYVEGVEAMQREVLELFSRPAAGPTGTPTSSATFQRARPRRRRPSCSRW